jgi:hypothetical protein
MHRFVSVDSDCLLHVCSALGVRFATKMLAERKPNAD